MQFIAAFIKKIPLTPVLLFIGGLVLGLIWAYVISPIEFVNATPAHLREDLQEDYLRMAIDSFRLNDNLNLAVDRWKNLGPHAQKIYERIQSDPRDIDPLVIRNYGEVVARVLEAEGWQPTDVSTSGVSPRIRTIVIGIGIIFLLGVVAAGVLYMVRLFGKRGSGQVTAIMQATQISQATKRTNFEELGLEPPITQTMTTYVLGDDLYDESFSIERGSGDFLGEYGVGISEAVGVGEPKKVTAFEVWLFDKNDIKTATKVLMSRHAFHDPALRARLEPKGELVLAEPQVQALLETATLQLLATVVDLEYGKGPQPPDSYFERITLELAVWPRQGQ